MAHIASCLVEAGVECPITTPNPLNEKTTTPAAWSSWRMQQSQPERKYQLFPKTGPLPLSSTAKNASPDRPLPPAGPISQSGTPTQQNIDAKPPASNSSLRSKIKEHGLIRRRKVSVPELGPMTTVQEAAMDSPTIPGRPPVHERSISAPGNRQHVLEGTSFFDDCISEDIQEVDDIPSPSELAFPPVLEQPLPPTSNPMSARQLAPLIIPTQAEQDRERDTPRESEKEEKRGKEPLTISKPSRKLSLSTQTRSGSASADVPRRPSRSDGSPNRRGGYTPVSVPIMFPTPRSAVTATAPLPAISGSSATATEARTSPKPWESSAGRTTPTPTSNSLVPVHDGSTTPKPDITPSRSASVSHGRNRSESGSIMERGRPRNRNDRRVGVPLKRSTSNRMTSAERKAFEMLPRGFMASEASEKLEQSEIDALYHQAVAQAARFEVLKQDEVEALSRELRQLDERCEYLRCTYTSLRAGRRNLHARICQHLRSPVVSTFRSESMLKQEEALAELDASIDTWVTKLEQAENRRTRIRQKLLEHIAAAALLPASPACLASPLAAAAAGEPLPFAVGACPTMGVGTISTPPRSPTKTGFAHKHSGSSDSTSSAPPSSPPHRPTAHVPSTIFEQLMVEEVATSVMAEEAEETMPRRDVESIRIYADSDVYALLADVENELTKMSSQACEAGNEIQIIDYDSEQGFHGAHSHEKLVGLGVINSHPAPAPAPAPAPPSLGISASKPTPRTRPPSPLSKNHLTSPSEAEPIFLTKAVFKPERPTVAV